MPRAKGGIKTRRRHKKILKKAKGYVGGRHRLYRTAKETLLRAGAFAYRDRRAKKRQFRSLWIVRINAAAHAHGLSYNHFVSGLKLAGCALDRKVLAELAAAPDSKPFANLVDLARQALEKAGRAAPARA